jgi:hypothetical protein
MDVGITAPTRYFLQSFKALPNACCITSSDKSGLAAKPVRAHSGNNARLALDLAARARPSSIAFKLLLALAELGIWIEATFIRLF